MAALGLSSKQVKELEALLGAVKNDPQLLYLPELKALKEFVEKFGGVIPPKKETEQKPTKEEKHEPKEEKKEEKVESKVEEVEDESEKQEPDPDLVAPDNDPPLANGDAALEVTDEMRDEATSLKIQALDAHREGKHQEAIDLFTKAIQTNPRAGILYASRAQVLLDMKKPNAAIRDCDQAIKIAPDSAKGYKIRGRAHRLLGNYEQAMKDINQGQKLDWDETTKKLEDELKPRVEKIILKKNRLEREKREEEAREAQKRREEAKRRQQEQQSKASFGGMPNMGGFGGFPGMGGMGGMPGMGGMGGMGGMPGVTPDMYQKLFSDPEMMAAMQDPAFMAMMQDIMSNPSNMSKYSHDPRLQKLMTKFTTMFGGEEDDSEIPDLEEEEPSKGPAFNFPSASDDVD